ncbi:MAG: EAL domain-containing protein [Clostridiales bacterium]|nr:EAL domain-containing protein [Clostridiales bacterium]
MNAMTFSYAYPICALLFLLVILLHFFSKRQLPVIRNRMFTVAILLSCTYAVFEVFATMLTRHSESVPQVLGYMVLTIFFLLRIAFPVLMILHTISITQDLKKRNIWAIAIMMIPAAFCAVVILTSPISGQFFYTDSGIFYRGNLFSGIHLVSALAVLACMICAILRRNMFDRGRFLTVAAYVVLASTDAVIEYFRPGANVSSVAVASAMLVAFLSLPDEKSMTDHLTGLLNLDAMMNYIDELIARETRYYVIVMKVENIRRINSIFGYTIGSLTLRSVAEFLSTFSPDLKERHGGAADARKLQRNLPPAWAFRLMSNQFAVVSTEEKTHEKLLAYLQKRFDEPWLIRGLELNLTLTSAEMKDVTALGSGEELYKVVEIMLPSVPKGDTVTLSERELERVEMHIRMEASLERALDRGALDIRFQPVLSLATGRFTQAEALVRFDSEEWGDVPPSDFIPIAEKRGLGAKVDEFVLRKTCEWIRDARDVELDYVSINVSVTDFISEAFPGKLCSILKEYGVPYKKIMLEIPDAAVKTTMVLMLQNMSFLSAMGVGFAMDGVPLSAGDLAQLAMLPISVLKLDRSVVEEAEASPKARILFENMIDLLRKMEIRSVVVGAETASSAAWIEGCRPDMVQGFYYARPMDGKTALAFVQRTNSQAPRKPGIDNVITVSDE